ncbi:MOSC domain-containing protein YiiM [Deinococcus metalli]|uniref:MOSC domain-containing protein n=1 Tax=Deinococcus metalli TaxID=1141878 RepID=A0A7W8NPC0_9DEIO|nr:MOSC domain-containing protein [Deinococcus metalli]MBB5374673.1 MOSC domain-containing protein YiiM [Deinococcus metalli]GHF34547.1 MOSC domain-containing protein [Deinococcus metalli]
MSATVIGVASDGTHRFSKQPRPAIRLLAGLGVEGDAHAGVTVQHRSRVRADPTQPNLRQLHLIHAELLDEVAAQGFAVAPADLGENVTTRGIDLLAVPRGTRLHLGAHAVVEVTGLRNPCAQIDAFRPGLLRAVLGVDDAGQPVLRAGIMAVVVTGGEVRPGDDLRVVLPPEPHEALRRV